MADFLNNPFVNAGMGLGGGLGAMPVAAPYTTAGVIPGAAMQFGNMKEAVPFMAGSMGGLTPSAALQYGGQAAVPAMAGLLGGAGAAGGAMAMQPPQEQTPAPQESGMSAQDKMAAYRMMAQGMQNMGRGMQQQMPSGNTAQIMRDQNQFRFAGTPQQQMANALRRR